eukprot:20881-Heterococcus_DN1.PRE.1
MTAAKRMHSDDDDDDDDDNDSDESAPNRRKKAMKFTIRQISSSGGVRKRSSAAQATEKAHDGGSSSSSSSAFCTDTVVGEAEQLSTYSDVGSPSASRAAKRSKAAEAPHEKSITGKKSCYCWRSLFQVPVCGKLGDMT